MARHWIVHTHHARSPPSYIIQRSSSLSRFSPPRILPRLPTRRAALYVHRATRLPFGLVQRWSAFAFVILLLLLLFAAPESLGPPRPSSSSSLPPLTTLASDVTLACVFCVYFVSSFLCPSCCTYRKPAAFYEQQINDVLLPILFNNRIRT